jgi:hypothetical protein
MEAAASLSPGEAADPATWTLGWLTPRRCRLILIAVLTAGFLGHLWYLIHDCPIDLSGDEAHYWDWSRQLGLSYYSKGPLVAYLIRASCAVFGDSMPAVRLPALLLAAATSLLTYWLTVRLFASERLALGAVLMTHLVPMFIAGSVLMTIDPPFYFCWAAATCLAAKAVLDESRWAWVGVGIAIGVGFLAKYAMFLWLPGLLLFLGLDPPSRHWLRSPWPWLAMAIAMLFTAPVIVWNALHGWPSLWHVTRQTGTDADGSFTLGYLGDFLGGQLAGLGPFAGIIIIGAVLHALGARREGSGATRFLLCMALPFWLIVALTSLRTKVQVNWPAPAYFTLLVLAARFLSTRMTTPEHWRAWRGIFWGMVGTGLLFIPIAHNTEWLYRPLDRLARMTPWGRQHGLPPRQWDPTYRLRGWRELGARVSAELARLRPGAMVICERYDVAAEMAFYVDGQPRTFYVGSWFADPDRRARRSQYDYWPDRSLDRPDLLGLDAIFIGYGQRHTDDSNAPADIVAAFARVERLEPLDIQRGGLSIRSFRLWRCIGFRGMRRPAEASF